MNKFKYIAITLLIISTAIFMLIFQSNEEEQAKVTSPIDHVITSDEQATYMTVPAPNSKHKELSNTISNKKLTTTIHQKAPPQKQSSQPFDSRAPQSRDQPNSSALMHGHEHNSNHYAPRPPGEPTRASTQPSKQ